MRLSDLSPEGLRAEITRRQLTPDDAVRAAALAAQFREAIERQRVREDEIKAVLDTPRFREIVVGIVDEVIKTRIGFV